MAEVGQELENNNGISYRVFTEIYQEEAAHLLTKAFIDSEPISSCVKQPYNAELASNISVCKEAVQDGVSVIAVDITTNKLVGITTAFLVTVKNFFSQEDDPLAPPESLPYYDCVMHFIAQLDKQMLNYTGFMDHPDWLVCKSAKVAVDGSYQGRGMATKLIDLRTKLAMKHGCKYVIAQTSALQSQKLYSKLGFEDAGEIFYKEFEFNGTKPFQDITICPSSKIFVLKL